ncbi:hypothetical protein N7468_001988 [Penicillium chermesinum]|uniref:Uncharacterized protein n=1 Tax=Penicillium chermesinum TaxID=63820 RepID=A0A9W9PHS4_9EURO|nr:uncharacterized protein N7468_001988 [Penicillium chermesinum]KAJ5247005.1 hypothetical protein N7468_001988 [Penicillium chermesinum]KAJ6145256.1 hypothetical protein N7470_009151 [Penicillium chermesinum]
MSHYYPSYWARASPAQAPEGSWMNDFQNHPRIFFQRLDALERQINRLSLERATRTAIYPRTMSTSTNAESTSGYNNYSSDHKSACSVEMRVLRAQLSEKEYQIHVLKTAVKGINTTLASLVDAVDRLTWKTDEPASKLSAKEDEEKPPIASTLEGDGNSNSPQPSAEDDEWSITSLSATSKEKEEETKVGEDVDNMSTSCAGWG